MPDPRAEFRHTNRLARETSPYLLQHAHNPVDWYPWGDEAFDAAKAQNKPIFLSVGYSTCYWCHVMERESFENEEIASLMNQKFICIKVDREQRPDIDQLYMTAVQVLTHRGGWPMSVFLTPDLKPFHGGTYYPPHDLPGRMGLPSLLSAIDQAYHERRAEVEQGADQLVQVLRTVSAPAPSQRAIRMDQAWIHERVERSITDYDAHNGGFGSAPKFPRQTLLELLLNYCSSPTGNPDLPEARLRREQDRILKMVTHTLDAMAMGGIRDHLGGGFHRYSTDARWLVPHFEIMLYDNAMLAWLYLDAYRQTETIGYAKVARGIMDFVLRELTAPQGCFYSALDAETDAREGATYLWTPDEVAEVMGAEDAALFSRVYGLDEGFNFADPHHGNGTADRNVLFLPRPVAEVAAEMKIDLASFEARLEILRAKLLGARRERHQPSMDRKVLTSWNALMIRALAYGGQLLNEPRYMAAASKAANYLLRWHRTRDGGLIRSSRPDLTRDGMMAGGHDAVTADDRNAPEIDPLAMVEPTTAGGGAGAAFLDDYSFLMQALIALRDATGKDGWQEHAAVLGMVMLRQFRDPSGGGFFFTPTEQPNVLVRQKIAGDSPLPSGNAVAAEALMDLGQPQEAAKILSGFAATMDSDPESCSALMQVAVRYEREQQALEVPAAKDNTKNRPLSPEQIAQDVVELSAAWTDQQTLVVKASIMDGFHINSHQPASGLRATQLTIDGDEANNVEAIDYPSGQPLETDFAPQGLEALHGTTTITVRFKKPVRAKTLRIALGYQPCDEHACLPVVNKSIVVAMA